MVALKAALSGGWGGSACRYFQEADQLHLVTTISIIRKLTLPE